MSGAATTAPLAVGALVAGQGTPGVVVFDYTGWSTALCGAGGQCGAGAGAGLFCAGYALPAQHAHQPGAECGQACPAARPAGGPYCHTRPATGAGRTGRSGRACGLGQQGERVGHDRLRPPARAGGMVCPDPVRGCLLGCNAGVAAGALRARWAAGPAHMAMIFPVYQEGSPPCGFLLWRVG